MMALLEKLGLTVPEGMEANEELNSVLDDTHALFGMVQRRIKELESLSEQYREKLQLLEAVGADFQDAYRKACAALDEVAPGHRQKVVEETFPEEELKKVEAAAERQKQLEREANERIAALTKEVTDKFGHLAGVTSKLSRIGVNPMMAIMGGMSGRPEMGMMNFSSFGAVSGPAAPSVQPRPLPKDHPFHKVGKDRAS